MKSVAIVISSASGHTRRIAEYVANQLDRQTADLEVFNLTDGKGPSVELLKQFDAVIVGCPVYLGDFPQLLMDWVWDRRDTINSMPSALFTVSLNAADPRPKAREIDDKVLRNLMEQTDYRPRFIASFGGALEYTQYGFFKRCILQGVSAASGGPTDTSRDFDLTQWSDVKRFANAFHAQDMSSEFATINRLPKAPQPSWPSALQRAA